MTEKVLPLSEAANFIPVAITSSAVTVHIGKNNALDGVDLVNLKLNNPTSGSVNATISLGANPPIVVAVASKTTVAALDKTPVDLGKAVTVVGDGLRAFGSVER